MTSADYLTDAITRRAVSFIDRTADRPFFAEVAYNAAHWPFQPPDRPPAVRNPTQKPTLNRRPYAEQPATRQDYARMVEHADAGIGQILTALERHRLTSNTLVIFTNGNGGEWLSRNAPFFNRKGSLWEGGIRVPLILRWPQRLPAGVTSPQIAVTMDLTATILSATQTAVPADYRLDGIDLIPHLREGAATATRQIFWRGVPHRRVQTAVRDGDWKLLDDEGRPFLFNVRTDPGERDDLAARRPDIVRKLGQLYEAWRKDVAITSPSPEKRVEGLACPDVVKSFIELGRASHLPYRVRREQIDEEVGLGAGCHALECDHGLADVRISLRAGDLKLLFCAAGERLEVDVRTPDAFRAIRVIDHIDAVSIRILLVGGMSYQQDRSLPPLIASRPAPRGDPFRP